MTPDVPITRHPWQSGPTELIAYAIEHAQRGTDFDRRIAFLLLDVGVETLLKVYLTLPEGVTGTEMGFTKRRQASEGSFHEVIQGVNAASKERLSKETTHYLEYYHGLRNKLYHQGDGMTVPVRQVDGYSELAASLLKDLLDVDLSDIPMPLQPASREVSEETARSWQVAVQDDLDPVVRLPGTLARHKAGKYKRLQDHLDEAQQQGENNIVISLTAIERLLGADLPPSARKHREWWGNHYGNSHAQSWLDAGWLVDGVDLELENVRFRRSRSAWYPGFFTRLLTGLKERRPGITSGSKVSTDNWYSFTAGVPGYAFGWVLPRDQVLRVELYIDTGERAKNKAVFDGFLKQKETIENEIGTPLDWDRIDQSRASRISTSLPFDIADPAASRDEAIAWGVDTVLKMVDVFRPRLRNL